MPVRLERLPPRITGFFDRKEPPRQRDPSAFRQACHHAAQMAGGTVGSFQAALLGRNHYSALLRLPAGEIAVLCNGVHPYLGFAAVGAEGSLPAFVAAPRVAHGFAELGELVLLDSAWLAAPLHPDLLMELAPVELAQVRHWKPERIGDVIFNHWD